VATPDPYQHWSGAPKHWVHVPAQRHRSPAPDQVDAAAGEPGGEHTGTSHGEWAVAAVALAVAVAVVVLIGNGRAVTEGDVLPQERTIGSFIR
jgi:hypothetical protein